MADGVAGRDGRTLACSRIGCDLPAVASVSFDAVNQLAWLDTVVEARGAGFLCPGHVERLTAPRGWSLLDRRSPEAKLFVAPAATPTTAPESRAARAPKRARAPRARHPKSAVAEATPAAARGAATRAADDDLELPFDDPPAMPTAWSPRNLPALDEEIDDRTPLLARAFESLRHHEQGRHDQGRPADRDPGRAPDGA